MLFAIFLGFYPIGRYIERKDTKKYVEDKNDFFPVSYARAISHNRKSIRFHYILYSLHVPSTIYPLSEILSGITFVLGLFSNESFSIRPTATIFSFFLYICIVIIYNIYFSIDRFSSCIFAVQNFGCTLFLSFVK